MRKRFWVISFLPLVAVSLLWLGSFFYTFGLSFGLRPYNYSIQFLGGALEVDRTFDCPGWEPLHFGIGEQQNFDEEFYDNAGERYSDQKRSWGVYSCSISYAINDGTLKLNPDYRVTPCDLVAIPYPLLCAGSALPLLAVAAFPVLLNLFRRNKRRIALAATASAAAGLLWTFWSFSQRPSKEIRDLLQSGKALDEAGDLSGAIDDFTLAIQSDPNCAEAYDERSTAKLNAYSFDGIDSAFADELTAYHLDHRYAANVISVYSERSVSTEDADAIISNCTLILDLDPQNPEAHAYRGAARNKKAEFAGALADLNLALRYGPYFAGVFEERAKAERGLGDFIAAARDSDKAHQLDWHDDDSADP